MLQGRRIAVPESRELDLFAGCWNGRAPSPFAVHWCRSTTSRMRRRSRHGLSRLVGGAAGPPRPVYGRGVVPAPGFRPPQRHRGRCDRRPSADLMIARGPKPAKVLRSIGLARTDSGGAHHGRSDATLSASI